MRFALEHRFDAPLAVVEDAMVDPAFLESLRLPDVAPPEVLERTVDGATVVVRTRYVYTGSLDSLARRRRMQVVLRPSRSRGPWAPPFLPPR